MLDKLKKFIKKHLEIIEPFNYPDNPAEKILVEDYAWHPLMIGTLNGRGACLDIELTKLKREIWNVFYEWAK